MSGSLSPTGVCNLALQRLGMITIQSITDQTDPNAIACNVAYNQAVAEVSRETPWNCLKKRMYLGQLAPGQNPSPQFTPIPSTATTWAPHTNYVVNQYVTYAGQLYQCLIANTSSGSFTVDLTQGFWFETTIISPNFLGPQPGNAGPMFEWLYGYSLPSDFVMLIELNGTNTWSGAWAWGTNGGSTQGSLYEIYQDALYCNTSYANVKYNRNETDTTKWDSLFTSAVVLNLATIMATSLRKDDASLSLRLRQEYKDYLAEARQKNGAEGNPRRYNIVSQSRFVRARYWGTNNG